MRMTTYVPTNKHTLKRMNSKTTFSVEAIRMLAWPWPAHACLLIHPSVCLEALEAGGHGLAAVVEDEA